MERTHLSTASTPIILRDVSVEDEKGKGCYKPAGFWYEVDGDWRRWCEAEDFSRGGHLHTVALNDCNILFIDSLRKLDEFNAKYRIDGGVGRSYSRLEIDWPKIAAIYDGLEIAPYQWERRLATEFMWYYGWDCASGVIWRPKNATVAYVGIYETTHEQTDVR